MSEPPELPEVRDAELEDLTEISEALDSLRDYGQLVLLPDGGLAPSVN